MDKYNLEDKYNKELAKILEECKDFRKEQGLSQMFVADIMDCQQQEVSKLERGDNIPTLKKFLKYIDAIGLKMELKEV